jgi:DNA helicase II / ATP-dependent DNA helicase PcrA
MIITEQQLIAAIEQKNNFPLDTPQKNAITYGNGPLWIIAGPGTGKTEVLVARCLKLVCCDNVEPGSIMATTFTEKAAQNLEDRITDGMLSLTNTYPQLAAIDVSQLRVGTLHALCNDILQEFRHVQYQNLRPLDDIENQMLIRAYVARDARQASPTVPQALRYLFGTKPNPNLWDWTNVLNILLDRIVEDRIDTAALSAAGGVWQEVAQICDLYEQRLIQKRSVNFARMQRHMLEFLQTQRGQQFLLGDVTGQIPPLQHVLVDEYQDTNPIQEELYFRLADAAPHNLTVVGDEDQALYRFRGGTVECMLSFGARCQQQWNVQAPQIPLVDNHRSDKKIVDWCNAYISSFPQMQQANARVPGKPLLANSSGRNGNYPSVGFIRAGSVIQVANAFADTVQGLVTNGILTDYSQCVLLLPSVKETPRAAGPYVTALRDPQRNIPVYNPRSRAYLEQPEVQQMLGAIVSVLDPNLQGAQQVLQQSIVQMVNRWIAQYQLVAQSSQSLQAYVANAQAAILQAATGARVTPAAPTILYRILAQPPFAAYQQNPEQDLRLSKITRLMEAFCSQQGHELFIDDAQAGMLRRNWLARFYYVFCGYLEAHGIDDDEEDEIICPPGRVPIMTIHQSKGLEFDFVFVGSLGRSVSPSSAHLLESDMRPYRTNQPLITHSPNDAAWHDAVRQHFVAYSRAKYALVLLATDQQMRVPGSQTAAFGGQGGPWVNQTLPRL